jgi:hypothetical protein
VIGYHAAMGGMELPFGVRLFIGVPLIAGLWSCTSVSGPRVREGTDYGRDDRGVWVRGPWELVSPSADIDDVIDQLCPAVMQLPNARGHDDGVEYCGLLYADAAGRYYASAPARYAARGQQASSRTKTCRMPVAGNDSTGVRTIEADFHSHPWPGSPITAGPDTGAQYQHYSIRIQFDTTCHVLKLVPHLNEPVPGELFERVGRTWQRIRVIPVADKGQGVIDPPLEVP